MYAGLRSGGMLPYAFGEVSPSGYGPYLGESSVFNLAGGEMYSPGEYNPYPTMGNFFDDLKKIADKVSGVASQASQVVSGQKQVVVIPSNQAMADTAKSYLPWVIGGGLVLYLAFRKRR